MRNETVVTVIHRGNGAASEMFMGFPIHSLLRPRTEIKFRNGVLYTPGSAALEQLLHSPAKCPPLVMLLCLREHIMNTPF